MPLEENLCPAVVAFQDYPFKTVTGLLDYRCYIFSELLIFLSCLNAVGNPVSMRKEAS